MSTLLGEDEQESESWVLEWLTYSENECLDPWPCTGGQPPNPTKIKPHQKVQSWILPT